MYKLKKKKTNLLFFLSLFVFHKFDIDYLSRTIATFSRNRIADSIFRSQIGHFPRTRRTQAAGYPASIEETSYHSIPNNWMVTEGIRLPSTLTNAIFDMAVTTSETGIDVDRSAGLEFPPLRWICHPRQALSNHRRKFHFQVQIQRPSIFSFPFFYRERKSVPPIFERVAILHQAKSSNKSISILWVRIQIERGLIVCAFTLKYVE